MSEETGGLFGVSLSQHHLEELLMAHAPPPPLDEEATKVRFYCFFSIIPHSKTSNGYHPSLYSLPGELSAHGISSETSTRK